MPVVDPQGLRAAAPSWDNEVLPHLDAAIRAVARSEAIHYSNFTTVAPALASVHVLAENFMQRELESKSEDVPEFSRRLNATADTWDGAEAANTHKEA